MAERPVGILARTAAVTELLAQAGPLTPADISDRSGLPRASVYRLVEALSTIGLTETRPGGQVGLSLRWLRLADASSAAMTEWAGTDPILHDLADRTGQTAFLSLPRTDSALCIRWAQGGGIGLLILRPGRSLPLHAGAAGRLCLAYRSDLQDVLARAPFPRTSFPHTSAVGRRCRPRDSSSESSGGRDRPDDGNCCGYQLRVEPVLLVHCSSSRCHHRPVQPLRSGG